MDGLYQALSSAQSGIFSPEMLGEVLEVVLQAVSGEGKNISESLTEAMIDDFLDYLKKGRAGQQMATLSNELHLTQKIKFEDTYGKIVGTGNLGDRRGIYKNGKNKSVFLELKSSRKKGEYFHFEYNSSFNPNGGRQGKMDVNFVLPDDDSKTTFRISAKN